MTADINALVNGLRPLSSLSRPREMIRQFTPNWFAATMGTGILALALPQIPGVGPMLQPVGEALWFLNIGLFILFAGLYTARWVMFGQEARRIFGHNTVSMFIGTIPMGLATIINGFLAFGLPRFGAGVIPITETLWWIDVAMSLACGVAIPYLMFTRHEHSLDGMTAVWLLPVVAAEVAGASGGLLAPHLADAHTQLVVLATSYVLWAYSVPVAFGILAILILRMALHKLPHESMAASSWLALGPIGTGSLGMLVLGGDAPAILAASGLAQIGQVAQGIGTIAGLLLWGFGLWWLALATMITLRYWRAGVPFNLGWWGYTFPLGVYAVATFKLGTTLHLGFFGIFGTILTVALAAMWLLVGAKTLAGGWKGHLFVSPCIAATNWSAKRIDRPRPFLATPAPTTLRPRKHRNLTQRPLLSAQIRACLRPVAYLPCTAGLGGWIPDNPSALCCSCLMPWPLASGRSSATASALSAACSVGGTGASSSPGAAVRGIRRLCGLYSTATKRHDGRNRGADSLRICQQSVHHWTI